MSMDRWDQLVVGSFIVAASLALSVPVAWWLGASDGIVALLVLLFTVSNIASTATIELSKKAQQRERANLRGVVRRHDSREGQ